MTRSKTDAEEQRIAALVQSRRDLGAKKTQDVLTAIECLGAAEARITIASVAREAGVSSWFIYDKPQLVEAIHTAATSHAVARRKRLSPGDAHSLSAKSLQVELLHTRERLARVTAERDEFKRKHALALGAALSTTTTDEILQRLHDAEGRSNELAGGLDRERTRREAAERTAREAEETVEALRRSLREMMRSTAREDASARTDAPHEP